MTISIYHTQHYRQLKIASNNSRLNKWNNVARHRGSRSRSCRGGKSCSLRHRVGRCCVCTLTLTVQDRPRHPPFLTARRIRRNTLADSFYAGRYPSHFRICMPNKFFFPPRTPMQHHLYDLSIMILRARANAFTARQGAISRRAIIRISECVVELIDPTARL